ncbi:PDR/VanB family oxidoreductase [Rhodococcus sp. USK13]|uniref:PDR/VanB family oxidoreductase n=1 Tax=Rhodococcus sp. USK13 TaxID=2806442 RepID=UPI001BD02A4C|nr:PDR/VanB family oxidoreductase [Rhodococcus sp. USK13]
MDFIDVVVSTIVQETSTVRTLYFTRPDGSSVGPYEPGAHVDVVGPTAVTRQYSLCSRPDGRESFAVAVKLTESSRGGSSAMHDLAVGDRVRISNPRNLLRVDEGAAHHVLIAAGIGITPMLSMARHLDVQGISWELHYFARSEEEAAFLPLLRERAPSRVHEHLGVSRADQVGRLTAAFDAAPEGSHVYLCGPTGFMDKIRRHAENYVPADAIHIENFQASETDTSGDSEFDVELDGKVFQVPAGRSIVDVLDEAGVEVDTSCQEGICGTCIMQVLAGTPDHRDNVLSKAERESGTVMAVCVSRSADGGKIVLEHY